MFFSLKFDDATDNVIEMLERVTDNLLDAELLHDMSTLFADMCDKYVPYYTGNLANSATPSMSGVTYYADYAEEVYERNDSNFYREHHPLATGHWDKVMMATEGDEFNAKVTELIMDKARQEGFKWR